MVVDSWWFGCGFSCVVALEDLKDISWLNVDCTRGLFKAPFRLSIFRPLLGETLVAIRLLERPCPSSGKTRSVGLISSRLSGDIVIVLEWVSLEFSETLPFPFLLSLRRSRIPLALRFLTAGLLAKPPLEDSRCKWAEYRLAEIELCNSSTLWQLSRKTVLVSICSGLAW